MHGRVHHILLLAIALLSVTAGAGCCRAQALDPNVRGCTDDHLDVTLHAYRAPANTHVLALNYRNIGDVPCRLLIFRRQNGYPVVFQTPRSPAPAGYPMPPAETYPPRVTLAPGEVAHSSFRWQTEPAPPGHPCQDQPLRFILVGRDGGGIVLTSRTLSPRVCSEIQDDDNYHPGKFVPDWPASSDLGPPIASPPDVRIAKPVYFENERLTLDVTLTDRGPNDPSCPVLLETSRNATGELRIDEVLNPDQHFPGNPEMEALTAANPNFWCHHQWPFPGPYNEFDFSIYLGTGMIWQGLGQHTFGIIQLSGFAADGEYRQVFSPETTINVQSALDIPRRWGKPEKGVRVDLTLDKLDYALGEDIPLHMATENLSSPAPVFDRPFDRRIGMAGYGPELPWSLHVIVEDEHGPIKAKNLMWAGSERPIPCPDAYPKVTAVLHEEQLSDVGLLPNKTGTYRIYATWSPYTSDSPCKDLRSAEIGGTSSSAPSTPDTPFVTVSSTPITIHIHESSASPTTRASPQ